MTLWVPPSARDTGDQLTAEVHQMVQRFEGTMRHWTQTLQRELNDDRLEVVFAPPYADPEIFTPGRYHVIRYNDAPAPPSIIPVEGLRGEFVEPGSWLVTKLRNSDLQNPQLVRASKEAKAKAKAKNDREMENDAEERKDHLKDAWNAAFRTSVSMNRDNPWTQNARGKKYRPKAA